ncbi:MAG: 1-(5-phosphoribosyl)-5-[(5-phosphoribosylamino)methylideneamino] imidazole-4-carboxamide isomerase, partial [Elusimicrobiota bacterium]|nr:1-(5-phosphoribosyl)-5-[(5-phosphoribosylamino)methylideneamino] imidazole-4-carboxamide isomerase [Elusimicrobiota bacterium]
QKGAQRLHIVDLDGAIESSKNNLAIIKKICAEIDMQIEVGGGIRDMQKIKEVFDAGADFVILGTIAVQKPEIVKEAVDKYGSEKIIIALDAKDDKVAVKGWKEISSIGVDDFIADISKIGIREIIYTDISRDGMLTGPDFNGLNRFKSKGFRIIVSGGIKTIDDLIELKNYESCGVIGAIVGSALYTDEFDLEKAIAALSLTGRTNA